MAYKEVIVVEGRHDEQKIKSIIPGQECIITNGIEVSIETLNLIKSTALNQGVILFLDPDFPGKQITNKILDFCDQSEAIIKIASISAPLARNKSHSKVGVEHANRNDLINSLDKVATLSLQSRDIEFDINDMFKYELTGYQNSKEKRIMLCGKLGIPYCNTKTLMRLLNQLYLSKKDLETFLNE